MDLQLVILTIYLMLVFPIVIYKLSAIWKELVKINERLKKD
jgi:hypothetical protein